MADILCLSGAAVEDLEFAVRIRRHLDVVAGVGALEIRNPRRVYVMRGTALVGVVQLPQVFEARNFLERLHHRKRAALLLSVIHDGYAGRDRVHERGAAALIPPVMRNDQQVHVPKLVHGTHQLHLLVPRQIAEIEDVQLAIGNHHAERAGIFGLVGGPLLRCRAVLVWSAGARQRLRDQVAVGAHYRHVNPGDWQRLAGVGDDMLVLTAADYLLISLCDLDGRRRRLSPGSVHDR